MHHYASFCTAMHHLSAVRFSAPISPVNFKKNYTMAKQVGTIKLTGTIDDVTFYQMNGKFYARKKSSLSREKVKHHTSFALTRMYNNIMANASSIASALYRTIPRPKRKHAFFLMLTGKTHQLLKQGLPKANIMKKLMKTYMTPFTEPVNMLKKKQATKRSRMPAVVSHQEGRQYEKEQVTKGCWFSSFLSDLYTYVPIQQVKATNVSLPALGAAYCLMKE